MKKVIALLSMFLITLASYSQIIRLGLIADAPPVGPTISVSGNLSAFTATAGTASSSQTFSVSGTNLSTNVLVSSPGSWLELSLNNSTWSSTVTAIVSGGSVVGQPLLIFARVAAAATAGPQSGNITLASTGATTVNVAASATVNSASATLAASPTSITGLNATVGTAGTSQSFAVTFSNILGNVTVTSFVPVEISIDGGTTYASSQTFSTGSPKTVKVRVASTATLGAVSGTITVSASGVTTQNVTVSGTVSSGGTSNDTVQVNIWDSINNIGKVSLAAPNFWNEWNINEITNPVSFQFSYKTGAQSPITAQFDAINSYVDNTAGYNSGTTSGFPVGAFRVAVFNTTTPNTLTLRNLPAATNGYKLILISSRNTVTTRPNTFAVGATTQTVDAKNNDTNVVLDNLTPSSGTITVNISSTNGFWFICGFMLIKKN